MPFGKKYRKAVEGLDLSQRFSVEEAVEKSLGASFAKFDETVDVAIGLGVDPKYSDQMVRGAVSLPHGLGKTVRVAVFCKGEKEAEARAAGADIAGAEELVAKIKEGWLEFDAAVATPDVMALVGQVGRVLGPRGGPEKILGNLKALVETVNRLKPSAAKGTYMKNMAVSTTMGPGFKVDMTLIKKFIEG